MTETDFRRECRKAFLKYGASFPLPRLNDDLSDIPSRFHTGSEMRPAPETPAAQTQ